MRRKASASTRDTTVFDAQLAEAFKKIRVFARNDRRAFNTRMRKCPEPFTKAQLDWLYTRFGQRTKQEND